MLAGITQPLGESINADPETDVPSGMPPHSASSSARPCWLPRHWQTNRWFATLILLTAVAACATEPTPNVFSERPFPTPTGPFAVGMREHHWHDDTRSNPFTETTDDRRRVAARFWYPARPSSVALPAPYVLDPNEFRGRPSDPRIHDAAHVRSNAWLEAPFDHTGAPYPVLLYRAGGGWPRFAGTGLGEELASHGYVVVSIGHDGLNRASHDADGRALSDGSFRPLDDDEQNDPASDPWEDLFLPMALEDSRFVLDRLEALEHTTGGFFSGGLALENVGAYGWSFGGAIAIELLAQERRVVAAVDLDGQLFGTADTTGVEGSFLVLSAPNHHFRTIPHLAAQLEANDRRFHRLVENARGTGAFWRVEGTHHGSFADTLYTEPDRAGRLRTHTILATTLRAFFGRTLRAEPAPWLDEPSTTFEEITVAATTPVPRNGDDRGHRRGPRRANEETAVAPW